ncbi:MAG: AAA family ATPase [Planctomycetota bacterium]
MDHELEPTPSERGFLRRLLRMRPSAALRREAAVVAFASGKGGTGKSFLTTNVAIGLHRRGLRVAVVDCDFGLANAHLLFGVSPKRTMQHLLDGQHMATEVLTPTDFGPSLIAGGSGLTSLAELDNRHMQMLASAFDQLAKRFDVLLLDCAAGLSPQSMITVLAAQHVVLVTNPEIAALTDAYAVIKCVSRQPERPEVHLAVNRVGDDSIGRASYERMSDVSRRFANLPIHYLGAVPEDASVSHRRLGQAPVLAQARGAQARGAEEQRDAEQRDAEQRDGEQGCETSDALQALADKVEACVQGARARASQRGVEARMLAQIRRW